MTSSHDDDDARRSLPEEWSRAERARWDSALREGIGDEHYSEVTDETFAALRERVRRARDTAKGRE